MGRTPNEESLLLEGEGWRESGKWQIGTSVDTRFAAIKNFAALATTASSHVDYPVVGADDVLIVLDDDDGIALVL